MTNKPGGRAHRALPTSIESALPVSSVAEEYRWLRGYTCVCGYWGNVEVQMQALIAGEGDRYYDRLDTKCTACGAQRSFYFDVTEVFAGYRRMFRRAQGGPDEEQAGD